ncbi:MAG: SH3 domain-containing protein [Desulfobacteraceae bacterium]|nr:MAG: SH3 domain-containing protein [Desulfobacteraceae bacterium]
MTRVGGIIFVVISSCLFFAAWGPAQAPNKMNIQIMDGQVRSAPSFLGTIVARLTYGDSVDVIKDEGAWKKVALRGGVQGWMHSSALTTKSIILKAGARNVQTSATGGEIALAGKGFSEEVEKKYKSLNRNLDYAWVDRMEKFQVSPEQMQAFLMDGLVAPREGGAQ